MNAERQSARKRIPLATYRLQFNRDFRFDQAHEIVDYLHNLGITDLYASPLFKTSIESTHGYDVCDPGHLNPNLGTQEQFQLLCDKIRSLGMGLLLDVVPNHMRADTSNAWWADVLAKGRRSEFASYFDIEWEPPQQYLKNKVLLPVLEDDLTVVLPAGKLQLVLEANGFEIAYYDKRFPVSVESHASLLSQLRSLSKESQQELQSLTDVIPTDFYRARLELSRLHSTHQSIRVAVSSLLEQYNSKTQSARARLEALIHEQHYHLAYWRTGRTEINYRRFFEVSELVCINVQHEHVFERTHQFLSCLINEGKVTGLRVDHPDGLWNPEQYFKRLASLSNANNYIVVEKILSGDEPLPEDWPVDGTTGYEFLNVLNGLFVDKKHEAKASQTYRDFIGAELDYDATVYQSKKQMLATAFQSEVNALTRRLTEIAKSTATDLTSESLRKAVVEMVTCFPVYRTYVSEERQEPTERETTYISQAFEQAQCRNPEINVDALMFLKDILHLRESAAEPIVAKQVQDFVMKFQELTGPVMAKGLEDTCFYRFNRLTSSNEVGGDPGTFGTTVAEFHQFNTHRAAHWPHSLSATATHDTKRGEDVRARINVLSEVPSEWEQAVTKWRELNASFKEDVNGTSAPDANDEYLLYQTLVGAWPTEPIENEKLRGLQERISEYMLKAVREAKLHTTWTEQNHAYETAVSVFIGRVLGNRGFLNAFLPFQRRIAFFGTFNSLSQTVLKIAAPGVPDFYQGTEFVDLTLVDPDNRRPVDFGSRQEVHQRLQQRITSTGSRQLSTELLQGGDIRALKMYVIQAALKCRRESIDVFQEGAYVPLKPTGNKPGYICAFARENKTKQIIAIAPRLVAQLTKGEEGAPIGAHIWSDTVITVPGIQPGQKYRNVFTDETIVAQQTDDGAALSVCDVFVTFPVALLEKLS